MTRPANKMAIMPESLSASANTYGEYINMSIKAVSSDGVRRRSTYLKSFLKIRITILDDIKV
jgi:hypothetical protein